MAVSRLSSSVVAIKRPYSVTKLSVKETKSKLRGKQVCLSSVKSNVTNNKNEF